MTNNERGSRPGASFVGLPQTRPGWWSIGFAAAFFVLFAAWLLYVQATPMARPTFFSDPLQAVLILVAAASAVTGGIVGVLVFVAKRERSFTILLSVLLGIFVLYWTIAELRGH